MPFQKGRAKTGGKKKGFRLADTVRLRLEALNCDPISGLVQLAEDTAIEPQIRAQCYSRLSRFIYSDASIPTDIGVGGGTTFVVNVSSVQAPQSAVTVTAVTTRQIAPPSRGHD